MSAQGLVFPSTSTLDRGKRGIGVYPTFIPPLLSSVQGSGWKEGPKPEQKLVLVSVQDETTSNAKNTNICINRAVDNYSTAV